MKIEEVEEVCEVQYGQPEDALEQDAMEETASETHSEPELHSVL